MPTPAILTHEIGSLAKTPWRIKAFSGIPLTDQDIKDAEEWGKQLKIDETSAVLGLLSKKTNFTDDEKSKILEYSSLYATRLLEQAGLDLVWDGEQHRVEMYEYAVRRMVGFNFNGHVRSFDNKYYCKASCIDKPEYNQPFHVEELEHISKFAKKPIKIPITGGYTIVDWSYDEHYIVSVIPGKTAVRESRHQARREFLNDVTQNVIYPNIKSLIEKGVQYIQIDEPAATTKKDEIADYIETTRQSIGDLAGKAFFSTHICFSDYNRLFPSINALEGILDEIHFEYANRDTRELGVNAVNRIGYDILEKFRKNKFIVGLGVLDVHTDFIESPELIRDRILFATEKLGDPSRIYVAPDCGLRTRTWAVSYQKLKNMVEGKNMALQALGFS